MTAIITDHPQTQRVLARLLGITGKKNGYLEGGGYRLANIHGRIVELPSVGQGGSKRKIPPAALEPLPHRIKTKSGYRTDPSAVRQLKGLRLMLAGCGRIIVATAPGGEGELLFRYIYNYLGCTLPFSRLWTDSWTDAAIREGLGNLREGRLYDNLYLSADARERAGCLTDMYASRALYEATDGQHPFPGRLQTVVLAMVCKRYLEAVRFKGQPCHVPVVALQKDGVLFHAYAREEYLEASEAEKVYNRLKDYPQAYVESICRQEIRLSPPLPHGLGTLQEEAEARFSMNPVRVREIALDLCRQGFITWPDTACRHIPRALLKRIPGLVRSLTAYPALRKQAAVMAAMKPDKACIKGGKTREHHALLTTGIIPEKLSREEKQVYFLVAEGMLRAFAPACDKKIWEAVFRVGDIRFSVKKSVVREPGWTALFKSSGQDGENTCLPELSEGEHLPVLSRSLVGKRTKAPALFTGGTLIGAMEVGGIGTSGERAGLIRSLMESGYILDRGRAIVPTPRGLEFYEKIKATCAAGVETTAGWEKKLLNIEKDPRVCDALNVATRAYAARAGEEIADVFGAPDTIRQTPYICPRCRLGKITFYHRMIRCGYSRCNLALSRQVCGKRLTTRQLTALFKRGKTPWVKGFVDKQGETFDAQIVFDRNGNLHFEKNIGRNGNETN